MARPPDDAPLRGPDGRITVKRGSPETSYVVPDIGTTLTRGGNESSEITEGQPNSCVWTQETVGGFKRGDWDCRSRVAYEVTSTPTTFVIKESLKLMKGDEVFFEQEAVSTIGRNLV
jgi:hypothetical protein